MLLYATVLVNGNSDKQEKMKYGIQKYRPSSKTVSFFFTGLLHYGKPTSETTLTEEPFRRPYTVFLTKTASQKK